MESADVVFNYYTRGKEFHKANKIAENCKTERKCCTSED